MENFSVREAKPDEQRELTRLSVRATLAAGHDDAFIDRVMPALTITLPSITAGAVQVAEQQSGVVAGVVVLGSTMLHGIALLNGLFVDPRFWRQGVGRMLSTAAVARAPALKAGAIMIYAEPFAEGFYRRVGAIKIGEGPFLLSPEVLLPHFLYILPEQA